MGQIINVEKAEFSNPESKEAAFARDTRAFRDLAKMIEENGLDRYADTSIYKKDLKKMTFKEMRQHMREIDFEQLCIKNHWEGEEKKRQKPIFMKQKAEESRKISERFNNQWDMIFYDGENLTEFEKKETEKNMKEHPEDAQIIRGMVNMIAEGINDPEHVTDYSD